MADLIKPDVDASGMRKVGDDPHADREEARELTQSERWILQMWQKAQQEYSRSLPPLGELRWNDAGASGVQRKPLAQELIDSGFDVTITLREGEFSVKIGEPFHETNEPTGSIHELSTVSSSSDTKSEKPSSGISLFHRDAGLFSYTAGMLGAVAFMALAIGPGWLGFLVAFLPASAFAAWAVSGHA